MPKLRKMLGDVNSAECIALMRLIETQNEKAENAEDRKRRKAFYLRNGLKETGLFVNVYDTDFELLTPDGELTFWEYVDFLREVMYEEYVEILRPTLIAMKKK